MNSRFLGIMMVLCISNVFTLTLITGTAIDQKGYLAIVEGESTLISGYISENTTWTLEGSPYIVVGDVVVEPGVFLTIEPGVNVKFTSGTSLVLDGNLIAKGGSGQRIVFTSNAAVPASGDWGKIWVRTSGRADVAYSDISYASTAILDDGICNVADSSVTRNVNGLQGVDSVESSDISNNAGFGANGSSLFNCTVLYNSGYGVTATGDVHTCTISHNNGNGISTALSVYNCTISYNGGVGVSAGKIENCLISNNGGIGASAKEITNCLISNNAGYGATSCLTIKNCYVHNNTVGGVFTSSSAIPSVIRNCTISENKGFGASAHVSHNYSYIIDSIIQDNAGVGISCDHGFINGSTIQDNGGVGIYALRQSFISSTNISSNGAEGIYFARRTHYIVSSVSMISCIVSNNTGYGVASENPLSITDCQIRNNGEVGIGTVGLSKMTGSVVSNHSVAGVVSHEIGGEITNSEISYCHVGVSAGPTGHIQASRVLHCDHGIIADSIGSLQDSEILYCHVGVSAGSIGLLQSSRASYCGTGITTNSTVALQNSEIAFNSEGLIVGGGEIHNCNIYNNTLHNIVNTSPSNVNATANWWGTTNETRIRELIHDYYDDYLLGRVFYSPYMTEPFAFRHDIAASGVVPSKAFVLQKDSVGVNVAVENQGFYTELFNVTVYANSTDSGDHFDDNVTDSVLWKLLEKNNGVVSEKNGRVECSVVSSSGVAGYITKSSYDLSDCDIQVDVSNLHLAELHLAIAVEGVDDHFWWNSNFYVITKQNAHGTCGVTRRVEGGDAISLYSEAWTGPTGALRIRICDGAISFYEEDTLRYSEQFALNSTHCYIYLEGRTWSPYAGMDYFDNFRFLNHKPVGTEEVTLLSGKATNIPFVWNTTGYAPGNYTISAYAWPVLGETDTTDNLYIDGIVQVVSHLRATFVSFSLSPNPAFVGQDVTLLGNLTTIDNKPVPYVKIILKVNGTQAATLTTNSTGWFKATGKPTSTGTYIVTASFAGSETVKPSNHTLTLTVLPKIDTKASFTLSPNPAKTGAWIKILGNLTEQSGSPIGQAPVDLSYSIDNGITWIYAGTLQTNSTGWFTAQGKLTTVGTFLVKVSYKGNFKYSPSSHIETLTINPQDLEQ
jgi:hypothetical protein